jgi:hypothetical protein
MNKITFFFFIYVSIMAQSGLIINSQEYFETPGLNVMLFHDYYPDGHQTGLTVIQNGTRVAANGDLRFDPTPNQWSPIPIVGKRMVNKDKNEISVSLSFPDSSRDRKGFNPIIYPDLKLKYSIRVKAEGNSFKIFVDLDKPLPSEWVGKVGFNFELFPGLLFGKSYLMDSKPGLFPRQANGPMEKDSDGEFQAVPMAEGNKLIVAPESDEQRMNIESLNGGKLLLIDGRCKYNNGWYVVRSLVPAGKSTNAIEWQITPNVIDNWKSKPVVQISQVGYHPKQSKIAVIELDKKDDQINSVSLIKYGSDGKQENVLDAKPELWGDFLRYKYYRFDFSKITAEGLYQIQYGDVKTTPFKISNNVYSDNVWQPTLEYFLPVQMCHMKVSEGYRVWHGLCHDDDAMMAPVNYNHFDGYFQGPSTLTKFKPYEHVPDLNSGGWHDAGDYDLRVESQAGTVQILAFAFEEFNVTYDQTSIDQKNKTVEIHKPDGQPDILQQIEHGVLTIINGYHSLGRLYRGIISPTLKQYTLLGDASNMTDHKIYNPNFKEDENDNVYSGLKDDDFVFTEDNPERELYVSGCLATASRVLKNYKPEMSKECITVAEELWQKAGNAKMGSKILAASELLKTTGKDEYKNFLLLNSDFIVHNVFRFAWGVGTVINQINDKEFTNKISKAVAGFKVKIDELQKENPYGVPYHPDIWGAGWNIQEFGVEQYFLNKHFPQIFTDEYMLNSLNFVLGCHPGSNTASFASGVGANSVTVAYGVNRVDWSYIPGGVVSGTALIRPDFPELKVWPYFWQQTEYVMGGGATNFMFLALAADKLLNQ